MPLYYGASFIKVNKERQHYICKIHVLKFVQNVSKLPTMVDATHVSWVSFSKSLHSTTTRLPSKIQNFLMA